MDCECLAQDFQRLFNVYWYLSTPGNSLPPKGMWPDEYTALYDMSNPAILSINKTLSSSIFLAVSQLVFSLIICSANYIQLFAFHQVRVENRLNYCLRIATDFPQVLPSIFDIVSCYSCPLYNTLHTVLQSSPPPFCASKRTDDIDALLNVITTAESFIYIAVMDYIPAVIYVRDK